MKKCTFVVLFSLSLALVACKKKKEEAPAPAPASGSAMTPADNSMTGSAAGSAMGSADGSAAGSAMAGSAEGSAAAGGVDDVKAVPAGLPAICTTAHDAFVKLEGCEKHDAKMRNDMIKAWNQAVTGSFEQYDKASADQKKTIEGSCESMNKSLQMLVKDC